VQEPVSWLPSFVPRSKELSFIVLKVTRQSSNHVELPQITRAFVSVAISLVILRDQILTFPWLHYFNYQKHGKTTKFQVIEVVLESTGCFKMLTFAFSNSH